MEKEGFLIGEEIAHAPKSWDTLTRGFWIRGSSIRSFPSGKELGRPGTVVRTSAVVCGRADGPHRPSLLRSADVTSKAKGRSALPVHGIGG